MIHYKRNNDSWRYDKNSLWALKDKLNIVKLTFSSGVNLASEEYEPHLEVDRCPLCGIALNEDGVCPKCGYKKP